ncbi:MAG: hypothetical protein AB8B55_15405 [Mariniblastus sp.]
MIGHQPGATEGDSQDLKISASQCYSSQARNYTGCRFKPGMFCRQLSFTPITFDVVLQLLRVLTLRDSFKAYAFLSARRQ